MAKQRPAKSLIFCAFALFLSCVCFKFVGKPLLHFIYSKSVLDFPSIVQSTKFKKKKKTLMRGNAL